MLWLPAFVDDKINVTEKMEIRFRKGRKHCENKSGKLSQDTPVLPQVVKLGHAPDKIQV